MLNKIETRVKPSLATKPTRLVYSNEATTEVIPALKSQDLFQGQRLIKIHHSGSEYLLRITQAGKLILTK